MLLRSPLGPSTGLSLMVALLACGCAALPPIMPTRVADRPALAARGTGHVTVDVSQLARFMAKRTVQAKGFKTDGIANLRLVARGPGMDTVTSQLMTFTDPPAGNLTLEVPQGPNRVFRLQGLSSDGHVLASLATVANVPGFDAVPLSFDMATTAAANVMLRLLDPLAAGQTDASGIRTQIATTDISSDLKAYVLAATGYDAATNKVTGTDPRFFRAQQLANLLYASGAAQLKPQTSATSATAQIQVNADLQTGRAGQLNVALRDAKGLPIANAAVQGEVFDLGYDAAMLVGTTASGTDDSGTLTFNNVGIGTFDVQLTLPDGTVAWLSDVNVRDNGPSYATYAQPATAAAVPQALGGTGNNLHLVENAATHDMLATWVDGGNNVHALELDPYGQAKGPDIQLGTIMATAFATSTYLPANGGVPDTYLVAWVDGSNVDVAALQPGKSAPTAIFAHPSGASSVQLVNLSGGDVAVVWQDAGGMAIAQDHWTGGKLNNVSNASAPFSGSGLAAAADAGNQLLLAWTDGNSVLSQRYAQGSGGAYDQAGPLVSVRDYVVPSGQMSPYLTDVRAAYDPAHQQFLVTWNANDPNASTLANRLEVRQMLPGAGQALSQGSFSTAYVTDNGLGQPSLQYVPARDEFVLGWTNSANNAVEAQRLILSQATQPAIVTVAKGTAASLDQVQPGGGLARHLLFTRETTPSLPGNLSLAYNGASQSYRTLYTVGFGSSGSLTLGEYKP